jgi:hypothetical protein
MFGFRPSVKVNDIDTLTRTMDLKAKRRKPYVAPKVVSQKTTKISNSGITITYKF